MRTQVICLLLFIVYLCPTASAQWTRIALEGRSVTDIAARGNILFAVTGDSGSVYRSTDGGDSWGLVLPRDAFHVAISRPTGTVFVLPFGPSDTLYRSTDNGMHWMRCAAHPDSNWWGFYSWTTIEIGSSGVVMCGYQYHGPLHSSGEGVVESRDDGLSWSKTPCYGGDISIHGEDIVGVGGMGSVTGAGSFISISTDGGGTWTRMDDVLGCATVAWGNTGIFAGRWNGGLFISDDTCRAYRQISTITATCLSSLPSSGILAGTDSNGVFYFSDNGDSLGSRNGGLTSLNVHALELDSLGFVYAGTDSGIWRRPLSEMTTSVYPFSGLLPKHFKLEQNYPNPFNPSTTIGYQLPTRSHLTLKVYDVLGREIITLVNQVEEPGFKSVQWDPGELATGVYLCRLQAGGYVDVKKLILLK